jgi:hypothetical protein
MNWKKFWRHKTGRTAIALLDSLAYRWDVLNEPAAAAEYYRKMAEINASEKSWSDAAQRYLAAFETENDSGNGRMAAGAGNSQL